MNRLSPLKTSLRLALLPLVLVISRGQFLLAQEPALALVGARLIDGTGRAPIEHSSLVIRAGKIRAAGKEGSVGIPKGAQVVDLRGKTLMPLLVCLHGHMGLTHGIEASAANYTEENVRAQLQRYLTYGVGAVLSLGNDQDLIYRLRDDQRAGNLSGARLYSAGRGFGVPGGYPPVLAGAQDRYRPKTPEEARDEVRELAAHQPDFVKIWVDDDFGRMPKMKPEIFRAVIDEAHRHGLRVVAHVFYLGDAKALVEAGVDGLGHSVRDRPVDRELIRAMKGHKVFLVPTLARDESTFVYADSPEWLRDPFFFTLVGLQPDTLATLESPPFVAKFRSNPDLSKYRAAFEMAKKNLRTLFNAGVKIGFGTDSGPPLRFQGYSEHQELQLMVESGLSPMQAILTATRASAAILGARDLGTLEPGKQADFLVLDANPLEDIRNTEKVSGVWQASRLVFSEEYVRK